MASAASAPPVHEVFDKGMCNDAHSFSSVNGQASEYVSILHPEQQSTNSEQQSMYPEKQSMHSEQQSTHPEQQLLNDSCRNRRDDAKDGAKRRCKKVLVVLLLMLITVAGTCAVMLLMFRYSTIFVAAPDAQYSWACYPCQRSSNGDGRIVIDKRSSDGKVEKQCCLINRELMENILSQTNKSSSRDVIAFPNVSNNSIHAFLARGETTDAEGVYDGIDQEDYKKVSGWTTRVSSAFSRHRIQLSDTKDEIFVKDAGIYVIYSRLEFNGPLVDTDSGSSFIASNPVWFGQRIMQENKNEPVLEDSLVKTCVSVGGGQLPCYTSQLFAVLFLPRASSLSVNAKPRSLISSGVRNSYFGLFKID